MTRGVIIEWQLCAETGLDETELPEIKPVTYWCHELLVMLYVCYLHGNFCAEEIVPKFVTYTIIVTIILVMATKTQALSWGS